MIVMFSRMKNELNAHLTSPILIADTDDLTVVVIRLNRDQDANHVNRIADRRIVNHANRYMSQLANVSPDVKI